MKRFSITDKLVIASLAISIVTIIIVATYSFVNARKVVLDRSFNQLTSVRYIKTNFIEQLLNNIKKEVVLAKSSKDIHYIVNQINSLKKSDSLRNVGDGLHMVHNYFADEILEDYYSRVMIIGKNKRVLFLKNSECFQQQEKSEILSLWNNLDRQKDVFVSDLVQYDSLCEPFVLFSSKITNPEGAVIGMMAFEVSSNTIDSIMLERSSLNGLGVSGESYLVGDDYLLRSSSRFIKNSILKTSVRTSSVEQALSGKEGTGIIQDYRDISVLSSYGKVNILGLNWVMITEIDYKEVVVPIYQIRNEIIFISIFIFFVVLMAVFFLSRRITYPIQKLNQAAREIGAGNLNIVIDNNLSDEIGELTDTFNKMSVDLKQERIKSLGSLIDGQDTERNRLSRELHDSLGQLLISLKLKYESCLNQSKNHLENTQNMEELGELFDIVIDETRRISNNLMPAALAEFGLVSAVRNTCNQISGHSGIFVNFDSQGENHIEEYRVNIYLFRIVQEALTNIVKHSKAKNAFIKIDFHQHDIVLQIRDDGIGFDVHLTKDNRSNGLNNMQDRVHLLSGNMQIGSKREKGTQIDIHIPI